MEEICQSEKKYSRKELEDLKTFTKYKEAFDTFDWNKTTNIATHVSQGYFMDQNGKILTI